MDDVSPRRVFEFWIGRAGSGKTHACLENLAAELEEDRKGPPLLLLVPEQATAQMEYRLATWPGVSGYSRARVLSFRSLAAEVFARTGGRPGRLLDATARTLLIRRALAARRAELDILGPAVRGTGGGSIALAESVGRAVEEFQRHGWTPERLRARVAQLRGEGDEGSALALKLHDLALVWDDYAAFLDERGMADEASRVEVVVDRIRRWDELAGSKIWIDGFASFTFQELAILRALVDRADGARLALCLDPRELRAVSVARDFGAGASGRSRLSRIGPERIFQNIEDTCLTLEGEMEAAGWRVERVEFPLGGKTRFSDSPALAHLESRALTRLRPEPFPEAERAREAAAFGDWPPGPVEAIEAEDRRAEVEAVARRIAAMRAAGTFGSPARWADFAVLSRDLDAYAPLAREIFPRFGIPIFVDERRRIASHPLARFVVSALRVARDGYRSEPIVDFLKSGLSPVEDMDVVARVEKLARDERLLEADWIEAVEAASAERPEAEPLRAGSPWRDEANEPLRAPWRLAARELGRLREELAAPDADPPRAVWNLIERCGCAAKLEAWIEDARDRGDEEAAMIHQSAWRRTIELLDRVRTIGLPGWEPPPPRADPPAAPEPPAPKRKKRAAKSEAEAAARSGDGVNETPKTAAAPPVDLAELLETFEFGLAAIQAGLIPPTLDQVVVGSIERSRTPPVKAVFAIGMNDGEFPRAYDEDPVLGDAERARLTEAGGRIGPDSRAKFLTERYLAYIALTRASRYLCVSRPLSTGSREAPSPSSFFRAVVDTFPGLRPAFVARDGEAESIGTGPLRPVPLLPIERARALARACHAARKGESLAPLARELSYPLPTDAAPRTPSGEAARADIRRALRAMADPPQPRLDEALAREFWGPEAPLSVTALEAYGECPFRFFARNMLRLEAPRDPLPGPLELGVLRHHILQRLFLRLKGAEPWLDWGGVDLERAEAFVETAARQALADREGGPGARFGRDALTRAIVDLAAGEIRFFVRALKAMGERYALRQVAAEFRFGRNSDARFVLTAGPTHFVLEGSVDRVDLDPAARTAPPAEMGAPGPPVARMDRLAIYDFKSSNRRFDASATLAGADLQLAAYALALERLWPGGEGREPGARVLGLFYWPLVVGDEEARGDEEEWAEPATPKWFAKRRPKGILDGTVADRFDANPDPPLAFAVARNKNGSLNAGGSWLAPEQLDELLRRVERKMIEHAEAIATGVVPVAPLRRGTRLPCDLCDFKAACRKEEREGCERRIGTTSMSRLRKLLAGGDGDD